MTKTYTTWRKHSVNDGGPQNTDTYADGMKRWIGFFEDPDIDGEEDEPPEDGDPDA